MPNIINCAKMLFWLWKMIAYPKCRFFCWCDVSCRQQLNDLSHTLHVNDSSACRTWARTRTRKRKRNRLHIMVNNFVTLNGRKRPSSMRRWKSILLTHILFEYFKQIPYYHRRYIIIFNSISSFSHWLRCDISSCRKRKTSGKANLKCV